MKRTASLSALFLGLMIAASADAQLAERVRPEYERPGLVVVAFAKDDPALNQYLSKLGEMSLGQSLRSVRKVQLDIVMQASKANPVVILVPDDKMKMRVLEDCDDVDRLCEALDAGRVSVEVVPHEGPWVRDYGPMFRTSAKGPVVVHAPYHDERTDVAKREQLAEINGKRLAILEKLDPDLLRDEGLDSLLDRLRTRHRESGGTPLADDFDLPDAQPAATSTGETTPAEKANGSDEQAPAAASSTAEAAAASDEKAASDESEVSEEDIRKLAKVLAASADEGHDKDLLEKLHYYDELYVATEKENVQRQLDEESAPMIGIMLLADGDVASEKAEIDIDGGNLMPMPDGQCLTTRGLLTRNAGRQGALREILQTKYGCSKPVFLYPLAGGVIEHVDMFVLPGGGNKVFLASFDPALDVLKPYWQKLNGGMSRLAVESAVAMAENARILRNAGYEVIEVPAPFPREVPIPPGVFYPTLLNGLVQMGEDSQMQFILPTYDEYEPEVQEAALAKIKSALGPSVDVETIEATPAAIAQGAIHCLTLVIPQEYTRWGNLASRSIREGVYRDANKVMRKTSEELEGVWHLEMPEGEEGHELFSSLDPKIIFRQKKVRFQYGSTSSGFDYQIVSKDGNTWTLKVDDDTMKVVWKGPARFEFVDDENHIMTAVRK